MPTPDDQTDVIAANERLTTERDTAIRERDEARAGLESATGELDQVRAALGTAAAERDQARADLATLTADRDRLAGIDRDFNRRLAAELAKHGVRAEAIPAPDSKPTPTGLVAQYAAIGDPTERARFLATHEKELRQLAIAR